MHFFISTPVNLALSIQQNVVKNRPLYSEILSMGSRNIFNNKNPNPASEFYQAALALGLSPEKIFRGSDLRARVETLVLLEAFQNAT